MQVAGKWAIAIKTEKGNVKLLFDVQYVPNLDHNLLSFGQLMDGGYLILFDNVFYSIQDKKTRQKIVDIPMTQNKMFPFEVSNVKSCALVIRNNDAKIWHLRYGHLHAKG